MLRLVLALYLIVIASGPDCVQSRVYIPEERIVGGSETSITDFPYMASIEYKGSHSCGGSIISEYWILTAAHCFEDKASRYKVRVGSSTLGEGIEHEISEGLKHPKYDDDSLYDYDIALFHLKEAIEFSSSAQPVDLVEAGQAVEVGTKGNVTGWGLTKERGEVSKTLKEVELSVVNLGPCNSTYWDLLTPRMFCAGYEGHDACQADSGGPMVANGKQIGVVSFGSGCGRKDTPGVFADVAIARDWITEKSGV